MRANDLFRPTLDINDLHGDELKAQVTNGDNGTVQVTAMYADHIGPPVMLYYNASHIAHFEALIAMLKKSCAHLETIQVHVPGDNVEYTQCIHCGEKYHYTLGGGSDDEGEI